MKNEAKAYLEIVSETVRAKTVDNVTIEVTVVDAIATWIAETDQVAAAEAEEVIASIATVGSAADPDHRATEIAITGASRAVDRARQSLILKAARVLAATVRGLLTDAIDAVKVAVIGIKTKHGVHRSDKIEFDVTQSPAKLFSDYVIVY